MVKEVEEIHYHPIPKPSKVGKSKHRKQKTNRQKLIKKLDTIVSEKVRSVGRCDRCGKTSALACAHIYSRRNMRLRWDLRNLLCLCYACHIHWAHRDPVAFVKWVSTFRDLDELERVLQNRTPMKVFDLEELLKSHLRS